MDKTEGEDLFEGDSAEGVPEEEGADQQAGEVLNRLRLLVVVVVVVMQVTSVLFRKP